VFKTWATKQGSPPALQPFSLSHPSVWSGPFQLEQYSIASPNCLKSLPFNSPKRPLSTVFLEHSSSGGSESRGCPLSHSHITSTSFTSPFSNFTSPPELHLALRHSHGYPTHPVPNHIHFSTSSPPLELDTLLDATVMAPQVPKSPQTKLCRLSTTFTEVHSTEVAETLSESGINQSLTRHPIHSSQYGKANIFYCQHERQCLAPERQV